ncbi:MAG: NAD-binding protein, partial [Pseudomonadota bacterium]
KGLSDLGIRTVVVDKDPQATFSIELSELSPAPIILNEDVTHPTALRAAGIGHAQCRGVIAVTENDHTNLKIAVGVKLLSPNTQVICRSEFEDEAANMASFGTDIIINPYHTFAKRVSQLTTAPDKHRLQSWFINQHSLEHINLEIARQGLPEGKWIICGFGRLGKSIWEILTAVGIDVTVVDANPVESSSPTGTIKGRGTEAHTLVEAGVKEAKVIVAASNDDANNLSILITARQLNSQIYSVGRVNEEALHALYLEANSDYIMRRSQVVANEVLTIISRPLVTKFLALADQLDGEQTAQLIKSIDSLTDNQNPVTWRLTLDRDQSPALARIMEGGKSISIADLLEFDADGTEQQIPLYLERAKPSKQTEGSEYASTQDILLPSLDTHLELGDQLLICHAKNRSPRAQKLATQAELVESVLLGNRHHIPLLRWLSR